MRILIISLPRTGSTSLLNKISKEKKLQPLFEPFDGSGRTLYSDDLKNIVLKTIVCEQHPKDVDNYMEWITNFSKTFDEVILLSRKDLIACAESHSYCVFNKSKGFTSYNNYLWEKTPIDEICYNNVIKWDGFLKELSIKLKTPITYYEDIYDINSEERLRKGNKPSNLNLI
jgi:hypothetical protein